MYYSNKIIALLALLAIVCHADETTNPDKYLAETCTTNADCGDHRCRTSMGTTRGIVQSKSGLYKFEVTNPDTGKTCSITKDARDARAENGELPGCCFAREGVFKYTPKEIAGFAIGGLAMVIICIFIYNVSIKKNTCRDSCGAASTGVCASIFCICIIFSPDNGGGGNTCLNTRHSDPPKNPTRVDPSTDR